MMRLGVVDTNGEGLLIDVFVASLITTNITQVGDDLYVDTSGDVIVAAKLYADCVGLPCTGITPIDSTTPGGLTMAFVGTYGGSIFGNGDDDNRVAGFGLKFESTSIGRFYFPTLASGSYLLEIEFALSSTIANNQCVNVLEEAEVDEHMVTIFRVDSNRGQCNSGWYNSTTTTTASCKVDCPHCIGDGSCDGGEYNTLACEWDGGDCLEFNAKYPECKNVEKPYWIGDEGCDGDEYNTLACGWDGGDCLEFNGKYPECNVDRTYWIGDGSCDGGSYNTTECGYDGGNCVY